MKYIDGFVLVVPKNKIAAYTKLARLAGKIWKKHGALEYFECIGDDLRPNMGCKGTTFSQLAKLKKGETVWFSFIVYKSKTHRNQVNAKVMKDPQMNLADLKDKPMPFDMKRMSYGGFKAMVEQKT